MATLITRKGKTSLHQLRKLWRERNTAICVEIPQFTAEDRERIAREDADIAMRRAAFPLH